MGWVWIFSGTTQSTGIVVRMGLEPGTSGFQVQCSNHSATLPLALACLLNPGKPLILKSPPKHLKLTLNQRMNGNVIVISSSIIGNCEEQLPKPTVDCLLTI